MESSARSVLLVVVLGSVCAGYISAAEVKYVCPPFDPATCVFSKPGPRGCYNDSQCESPKKCCCSNCGWSCVDPVEVKPGRCPLIFARCSVTPPAKCHNDSGCENQMKCCNICGLSCWKPAPEPVGVCPKNAVKTLSELQCPSVQCSRDGDCRADEKCCNSGDQQTCVTPVDNY